MWVVGMILGSPAQMAGMEQGDQLLQIDQQQIDGQSPFQAATAISGGDGEPDSIIEPTVLLQVCMCGHESLLSVALQQLCLSCKCSTAFACLSTDAEPWKSPADRKALLLFGFVHCVYKWCHSHAVR